MRTAWIAGLRQGPVMGPAWVNRPPVAHRWWEGRQGAGRSRLLRGCVSGDACREDRRSGGRGLV